MVAPGPIALVQVYGPVSPQDSRHGALLLELPLPTTGSKEEAVDVFVPSALPAEEIFDLLTLLG